MLAITAWNLEFAAANRPYASFLVPHRKTELEFKYLGRIFET